MQFQVPQFIERESKIVGPLTFKQFLYLAGAGLVLFLLYFYFAAKNFVLFMLLTFILIGVTLSFAFINIGGRPLPAVLLNLLSFSISPKIYLWRKREISPMSPIIIKTEKEEEKPSAPGPIPRIAEKSQLKKLSTKIEIGIR